MSFLELILVFAIIAVVSTSLLIITSLATSNRLKKNECHGLALDLGSKEKVIADLRQEIDRHRETSSEVKTQLAVCQSHSERTTAELAGAHEQIQSLKERLKRYVTIDDAEAHAEQIKKDAEKRVAELSAKSESIKSEAVIYRDQAVKLKTKRDSLNSQLKSLQMYKDGCDSIEKLNAKIEDRQAALDTAIQEMEREQNERANKLNQQIDSLESELENRRKELDLVDDAAEMQSFGVYHPKFNFDHSERYRDAIKDCTTQQKEMIREKTACVCETAWSVGGSEAKGRTMTNQNIKLMLRAVNGECDGIIAKVTFRNVEASEKRIKKCFEMINKLGKSNDISFSPRYEQLKLQELYLNYEYEAQKQEEKEREREQRELIREEEKAEKEIKKGQEAAEKDEATKTTALEKARQELADQHGKHNDKLEKLVQKLEEELKEALDRKAKAIARAQLTKSGHVYVLSNVGTMGKDVYKIGMTRRLEPLDRVKELGDASVPFPFDVHAMIYSEDAPKLENSLHKYFEDRRVNLVNLRREFFYVTLDEIRDAVSDLHGLFTFRLEPEAEQFRTSEGLREEAKSAVAG
ncbi:Chromosome partition protein Smc [Stieleria neptunia]|uniref:Chromosome partition protein Smc n=1 Tax=Stieleria neptunia TaxID=2527979 RepID=A0A518HRF6_9BACT|nr:DUF4041 domain-containing protein [Stieleria neptunia]QDV43435.1 Chromosome partition protein Smc [Stieleria neptunia]